MFLAEVVGTVVSPVQIRVLDGEKLLIVRPLQAGVGDRVLVIDEGNSARTILGDPEAPVKTVVVGVVDYVEMAGGIVYDHRRRGK
jgi:microcompartment protein CcmK/EutM